MRYNGLFPMDLDGWSAYMFPVEPLVRPHMLSHISSFVDNSLYHSRCIFISGSMVLQGSFNYMSTYTGAALLWFASGLNSNINENLPGNAIDLNARYCTQVNHITSAGHKLSRLVFWRNFRLKGESFIPVIFKKMSNFSFRQLCKQAEELRLSPMLSLAATLIPRMDNIPLGSQNVLSVPPENDNVRMQSCMSQCPCEVQNQGSGDLYFSRFNGTGHAVEPQTGIAFPTILDNNLAQESNFNWMSEILVGTGSRTMKIVTFKSMKVYAFGFYVHPYDICEKLGPKYASITASEVNEHQNFYQDLLREDISMTVKLVVSVNGMRTSTVRNAFKKSLGARLIKINPNTDFECLKRFGSLFSQDIPVHAGTTICFRRTADGHLITEVAGKRIGAVHSKDLCRALFDMYIGDSPVSEKTKDEIGRNVVTILRRC